MNNEEIVSHLKSLNWTVNVIQGNDGKKYVTIGDYEIELGGLAGKKCDVAFEQVQSVPYTFPSAIHTKPHMLPMDVSKYNTQNSGIGQEWQYWSRSFSKQLNPQNIIAHIASIFRDVKI